MLQKTSIILLLFFLGISCKKDPKNTPTALPDGAVKENALSKKAYHFFSTTKELELLYQSDAWHLVIEDAKKIGLQYAQVAKLDSTHFIHYALANTKTNIFDQRMEALPAFKNFKEMSQSLSGTPLDYHQELTPLFRMRQDSIRSDLQLSMILYYHTPETSKKQFPSTLFQKNTIKKFENHLKSSGITSFELYQQEGHLYTTVTSPENSALEDLRDKLHWNLAFDSDELVRIKQTYPEFDANDPIFEKWKKMVILQ